MAKIEVTVSEIRASARKISKASSDFLSLANQVLSSAEALSQSWEGDSQVAFIKEQQQANEWYKQMTELVNTYVSNLQEAADTYANTDEDASSIIRSC